MAIPLIYNIRSVKERWTSNLIAILSIAGVVAVFVAILSMAKGFQLTLVESGSPRNAIVRRGGAQAAGSRGAGPGFSTAERPSVTG